MLPGLRIRLRIASKGYRVILVRGLTLPGAVQSTRKKRGGWAIANHLNITKTLGESTHFPVMWFYNLTLSVGHSYKGTHANICMCLCQNDSDVKNIQISPYRNIKISKSRNMIRCKYRHMCMWEYDHMQKSLYANIKISKSWNMIICKYRHMRIPECIPLHTFKHTNACMLALTGQRGRFFQTNGFRIRFRFSFLVFGKSCCGFLEGLSFSLDTRPESCKGWASIKHLDRKESWEINSSVMSGTSL